MSIIHIYGQYHEHGDVAVIGTIETLIRLREAIDKAISSGHNIGTAKVFTADCEGFDIVVVRVEDITLFYKVPLPYVTGFVDKRQFPQDLIDLTKNA